MCLLLRLIFNCWQLIEINFLIDFLFHFFIIAINLFRSNYWYWLIFEAMVVHPMGVGVSISLPLELGLDSPSVRPASDKLCSFANRNAQIQL